jgi:hypothetical protein
MKGPTTLFGNGLFGGILGEFQFQFPPIILWGIR